MYKVAVTTYECYCGSRFEASDEDEFESLRDYCPDCRTKKSDLWDKFLDALSARIKDPLINSIFSHGKIVKYDECWGQVFVLFPQKFKFFEETLRETMPKWFQPVNGIFGEGTVIIPVFEWEY